MKLGEAVAVFGTKRSGSRYMKDAYAPYYVSYALDGTYACTCDIWGTRKVRKKSEGVSTFVWSLAEKKTIGGWRSPLSIASCVPQQENE